MKKLFLIGLAATAMLTSCSNDETVDMVQSKAIGFSNAFVDNGTRSIIDPSFTNEKDNLEDFAVYGYTQNGQIFNGVKVYKGGTASTGWSYDQLQYWVPGSTYTFGAIAPFSVAGNVSNVALLTDASKVGMSVAFTNTDAAQIDLLHAAPAQITEVTAAYQIPVAMIFKHQLAKVKFSFLNSVNDVHTVKVTNIKINNAKTTGTLTIDANTDNAWSAQDGSLQLNFGNAVANDATTDEAAFIEYSVEAESYNEKLMIPTDAAATYEVTFTVELYTNNGATLVGTSNKTVTISGVELKLGYCYDFKATFTKDNVLDDELYPIEFTVEEVSPWNKAEQDQELPLNENNNN